MEKQNRNPPNFATICTWSRRKVAKISEDKEGTGKVDNVEQETDESLWIDEEEKEILTTPKEVNVVQNSPKSKKRARKQRQNKWCHFPKWLWSLTWAQLCRRWAKRQKKTVSCQTDQGNNQNIPFELQENSETGQNPWIDTAATQEETEEKTSISDILHPDAFLEFAERNPLIAKTNNIAINEIDLSCLHIFEAIQVVKWAIDKTRYNNFTSANTKVRELMFSVASSPNNLLKAALEAYICDIGLDVEEFLVKDVIIENEFLRVVLE